MTLTPIDWIIIVVYLVGCIAAGVWMRRYVRNVDDFAVAGREMDLNLGIASLAATEVGIVTVMYAAQAGFEHGFTGALPGVLGCLAMLVVGLTGFIIVPLRNAGVLTIPELFEKRFGKRVRWLSGVVVIVGGLLNMGIFLRMGGEFLTYVAGLDARQTFTVFGFEVGILETAMTALLAVVLLYTALGGMLSVLVTDYLQFLVMGLGLVVTSVLVIWNLGWSGIVTGLDSAHKNQVAVIDTGDLTKEQVKQYAQTRPTIITEKKPVDMTKAEVEDIEKALPPGAKITRISNPFNPITPADAPWVIWQALLQIAIMTTWQTTIARVLAARDARTAQRIYTRTAFYFVGRFGLPGLWGIGALLYFINTQGGLPAGTGTLNALPLFLGHLMPPVLIGILIAAMLAAEMSTDSGYLLTWATVIYNDIIGPMIKRPLSSRAKLLTVRLIVVAIGVFLVFYGLWYKLPGGAWAYLALTGTIYMASMFALLVGALYWKWTNATGALCGIVLGALPPLVYIVGTMVSDRVKDYFSDNMAGLAAFVLAFAGLIVGSLVGGGKSPAESTAAEVR